MLSVRAALDDDRVIAGADVRQREHSTVGGQPLDQSSAVLRQDTKISRETLGENSRKTVGIAPQGCRGGIDQHRSTGSVSGAGSL